MPGALCPSVQAVSAASEAWSCQKNFFKKTKFARDFVLILALSTYSRRWPTGIKWWWR